MQGVAPGSLVRLPLKDQVDLVSLQRAKPLRLQETNDRMVEEKLGIPESRKL
jgi:hypothetical protein